MDDQQALAGSADAQQHFLDHQVSLFLFDLKNEATEHGFKSGESWHLQLATEAEMADLKRHHHLIVSLWLQPQTLLKVYQQAKRKLQQTLSSADITFTVGDLINTEKRYLAAYPSTPNRK